MKTQRGAPVRIQYGPSQYISLDTHRVWVSMNANRLAEDRKKADISGHASGGHRGVRPTRGPPPPTFDSEDRFTQPS
jgi:hypothetical protein